MNLERYAEANGVEAVHKGSGHWQLKGKLLVNYYPDSKSRAAYVAGTKKARKGVTLEEAVAMCLEAPKCEGEKDKRRKGSRARRQALINRGLATCHWCSSALTIDTATLEHIIPLALGGLDNANNWALACEPCNQKRGGSMPELNS
jgi:5-methylcytosine-specific restriction endonuclease McrA